MSVDRANRLGQSLEPVIPPPANAPSDLQPAAELELHDQRTMLAHVFAVIDKYLNNRDLVRFGEIWLRSGRSGGRHRQQRGREASRDRACSVDLLAAELAFAAA